MPQLNSNSSNIELLDVSQIEFVRGPQSPLFGRNTLGGIVNVTTARPSMSRWSGTAFAPFGNAGLMEVRGNVSGPVGDKAAIGFAGGYQQRDGYTVNAVTGNDLDSRDGTFGKAQFMVLPNANWETRFIYAHERNRDGDYALGDLDAILVTPHRVARDFEGFTNRDINSATFNVRGTGQNFAIESTTGFVKWNTEDATDLDYSPLPLATRLNEEADRQFTQEIRISSPANAPMALTDQFMLRWQAGVEYFNQAYEQDAVNYAQRVRAGPAGAVPGGDDLAGSVDRQCRHRPLRARHAHHQRQDRPHRGPALRSRIERRRAADVFRAGDPTGECRGRRAVVLGRVAAVRVRLSRQPGAQRVRVRVAGLQGRRLQSRRAAGQRGLRRRTCVARRGRA